MMESKCLECNVIIGGLSYWLWDDNQFVGEMDGVWYFVWFEQVNLFNY